MQRGRLSSRATLGLAYRKLVALMGAGQVEQTAEEVLRPRQKTLSDLGQRHGEFAK